MRKSLLLIAASAALLPFSGAQAAVTLSAQASTNPYSGPTPTYDFSSAAPITGGEYRTGTVINVASSPYGTDDPYYAVGPAVGTPAVLDLSDFAMIGWISFTWGSVDTGNTLELLGRANEVLATITGTQVQGLVGTAGEYFPAGALVRLAITGDDQSNIGSMRFSSRNNAFEFDNVAVAPVPEPGVWALMLLGFAGIGLSMRRRKSKSARVRYAF